MKLLILLLGALLFDVTLDHVQAAVPAHGVDVVPTGPEGTAPKLRLDPREAGKDRAGGDALDGLHDLGGTKTRDGLDQEMHVVTIHTDLQEVYLVAVRYLQTYLSQNRLYAWIEDRAAILGGANGVVEQN